MKTETTIEAGPDDLISVYVGDHQSPPMVTIGIYERLHPSARARVVLSRAQIEAVAKEVGEKLAVVDRIAATRRGEAVPAVAVSDGEAVKTLLRNLIAELDNAAENVPDNALSCYFAAKAYLGLKV